MPTAEPLGEDEIKWIKSHTSKVLDTFGDRFRQDANRFKSYDKLLKRFKRAEKAALEHGLSQFHAVHEAHNELCVAFALLDNREPLFTSLEYEPSLPNCKKTIDFRAISGDDLSVYVDVKTISPRAIDSWEKFEEANKEGWFPKNVHVCLGKEELGGEIWHDMFAARSRMLEHTHKLEQKISDCIANVDNTMFILALCGGGVPWREGELEDFVSYYFSGKYRFDDPFANMTANHIRDKGISLEKSITRFAYFRRAPLDLFPEYHNWNVRPPSQWSFE